VRRPSDRAWWLLLLIALAVVAAWPPQNGRSLALKATSWLVDPTDTLPILPPQLGFGMGDDVTAVEVRDEMVRRYDEMYGRGGLTRLRMDLKVAEDPFTPATERQLLLVFGVVAAFLVWRFEGDR
jgi:hypothetical protein